MKGRRIYSSQVCSEKTLKCLPSPSQRLTDQPSVQQHVPKQVVFLQHTRTIFLLLLAKVYWLQLLTRRSTIATAKTQIESVACVLVEC